MQNVVIKAVARVTGDRVVYNEDLVQKYKEEHNMQEDKAKKVLEELLGREKRHVISGKEYNSLYLGALAVDKLLENQDIDRNDIDMVIFCSQFPEYTCPTQSVLIHSHCKLKRECLTLDLNSNCASGLYGLSVARSMLLNSMGEAKKALVVASDLMSTYFQEGCLVTEGCFGDSGVALLLEVEESDRFIGLSEAKFATTDEAVNFVFYPECGNSNQHRYVGNSTKISWFNPDYPLATNLMGDGVVSLLDKYKLSKDELNWVCCSQFTKNVGIHLCEHAGIELNKLIYVGDKYGYTGVSSPLMAYIEGLEDGRIKDGNIIGLTTIGLGGQTIAMIYKQ